MSGGAGALPPAVLPRPTRDAALEQQRTSLPITARRLTKTYGALRALDEIDLEIQSGEFLTLLGPSGSGKTTLLMVLAGFVRPDHGSLRFGDAEVIRLAPHKRCVGVVFQNYALFPHLDVAGNIGFPLRLRGCSKAETARRVEQVLDLIQLPGFGRRRVHELSGGQRQRVALARAIVFEPSIVLMDEPLSALDKQLRERMQIELRRLHERLGMTTVYVTHDQREALTMSDRIAVIHRGRVMQIDTPRAIYERPLSRFVAEFIGESAFLPVVVAGHTCFHAGQRLRLGGRRPPAGTALLMLRPERLRILDGVAPAGVPGGPSDDLNVFRGRVLARVYQGESVLLQVELGCGSEVSVRTGSAADAAHHLPAPGESVLLGLAPEDTLLLPAELPSA